MRLWFNYPPGHPKRRDFLLRKLPHGAVCAEIGVLRGDFSERILKLARARELHLIDPWGANSGDMLPEAEDNYRFVRERFASEIAAGRVIIHRTTSLQASSEFPDSYFDWVYIDGNHFYESVKQDLEVYCRKLKPGGALAGDDYHYPGNWYDGVTRAVDEFIRSGACTPLYLRRHSIKRHSQYMLRKPRDADALRPAK